MGHDGPASNEHPEPGVESEGLGPVGIVVGGITHGVKGVVDAVIGEGIIGGAEAAIESHRVGVANEAYAAGMERGRADAESHTSSPTPHIAAADPKSYDEGYQTSYTRWDDAAAEQAGYAAGTLDSAHNQESPVPAVYEGNAAYADAYSRAQADYLTAYQAGLEAGQYAAATQQELPTPPEYANSAGYAAGYSAGGGT